MPEDVKQWLEDLGLGKYADLFADNDVGFDVLPDLDRDDLKELGVSLGDTKRLLRAIEALSTERPDGEAEAGAPNAQCAPTGEAERRHLTVMFCDLVGSTELSARFDPEDLSAIVRAYQDCCAGIVSRFGGYVARYMGDGMLVYFGYPRAHEDDAERAIRAGLLMVESVGQLAPQPDLRLKTRIGVASGLVVVGESVGEASSREQVVMGETPNLAARLQSLASPDSLVISESTRNLAGDLFEYTDIGVHRLKGFDLPVRALRVDGARALESRYEAKSALGVQPIVGRDQELALLLERWRQAKDSEGQMVLLSGEAGIGKSRIAKAIVDQVSHEPHFRISYQCSPYHTDSPLYPATQQLRRAAGLAPGDSADEQLDKLEGLLRQGSEDPSQAAPLIASLLGLELEHRYGRIDRDPQLQRVQTLEALLSQLTGLAATRPVLFVLEDAHWIDPSTLELIELCLEKVAIAPILMLVTARPHFDHGFGGHPIVTRLTLNRLGRAQIRAIVDRVSGGNILGEDLLDEIAAKTDGVPLFIEELTKAALDSGSTSIPASLHDSLMARLDRVPDVREVAQIAAVIGRVFDHELLTRLADHGDANLRAALEKLIDAELVFRRGEPPDATYTFKHALVRDAAYESLLKARRRQLHEKAAGILEERSGNWAESHVELLAHPELVAYHYTEAGMAKEAIDYWFLAGERARSRSANYEAIAHLGRGISLASELADEQERARYELNLQFSLGGAYLQMKGHSAPEVEGAFARARELCVRVGDAPELVPTLFGLWRTYVVQMADSEKPEEVAAQLLRLAEEDGSAVSRVVAHYAVGFTAFVMGQFSVARDHLREGIELYSSDDRDTAAVYRFGQDPGVACCCYLALVEWALGYPDKALAHAYDGVALARRLEDPFSVAFAHGIASFLDQARGDRDACSEKASEQINVATEREFPYFTGIGQVMDGWAEAVSKPRRAVIQDFGNRIEHHRALGTDLFAPYFLTLLGEVTLRANQATECIAALDEAERVLIRTGERWWESETHRLRGAVLVAQGGDCAEAQGRFEKALVVARQSDGKSFELRAAVSLAQLWQQQERWYEARQLLAPLYNWFTEGHDSVDLVLARSLLDELEATGSDTVVD